MAVAMASELDQPAPPKGEGAHGSRVVVIGTANLLFGQNWQEPVLGGGAIFVESALSWLLAQPVMVDVPDKPATTVARIDEAALDNVYRYVVLYVPTAVLLLGCAVYLRRRVTERRRPVEGGVP